MIFSDTAAAGGTAGTVQFGASVSPRTASAPCRRRQLVARARGVGRGARVGPGAGRGGRLKRRAGVRCWPGRRRAGERARHAARAGAGRARAEREVQRGADRRQRARPGRGPGRGLLVRGAVQPARPAAQPRRRRGARQRPGQPGQRVPGRARRRDDGLRVELPHDRVQPPAACRWSRPGGSCRCTRPTRSPASGRSSSTSPRRCLATSWPTRSPGRSGSTPFGQPRGAARLALGRRSSRGKPVHLPDHGATTPGRRRRTSSSTRG